MTSSTAVAAILSGHSTILILIFLVACSSGGSQRGDGERKVTQPASGGRTQRGGNDEATHSEQIPRKNHYGGGGSGAGGGGSTKKRQSAKPNIIFIITDDQDAELGSLNYMPKTMKILRDGGATFTHAYTTTPMCCPSRSSMLTGMYVHNHNTYTNNDNCSSPQWQATHETRNFGTYLTNAGYRTGYFGKYLNEYTGSYIPPGWTEWMGLIRNTRFYNYSINFNGRKIRHEDDYHKDYLTDLIANDSVAFLRQSKQYFPNRPVAMVLSMPAPHGPEDSAPQYQNMFFDVKTHRTESWNFAPNPDKQWLLQYTGKMLPLHIAFTDLLHTKRLQTLQSVDDAVQKVYDELLALGELRNTYIVYTSDHGYHLGQYGLVKGKAMPYEFDIRVPFFMRGPRIPPGIKMQNVVINLDIAPTLLDIAGISIPDHMDGNSIIRLFEGLDYKGVPRKKPVWRDTFLVERGFVSCTFSSNYFFSKLTVRKLKGKKKHDSKVLKTKEERLEEECSKIIYQSPCKQHQQWECRRNEDGKLRIYKCRRPEHRSIKATISSSSSASTLPRLCRCTPGLDAERSQSNYTEKQRQLDFLIHHVNRPEKIQPGFIPEKRKRHIIPSHGSEFNSAGNQSAIDVSLSESLWIPINTSFEGVMTVPCRMSDNSTVVCERYVYSSVQQWQEQKDEIDRLLKLYTDKILFLKDIRKHLIDSKPSTSRSSSHHRHSHVNDQQSQVNSSRATTQSVTTLSEMPSYVIHRVDARRSTAVVSTVTTSPVAAEISDTTMPDLHGSNNDEIVSEEHMYEIEDDDDVNDDEDDDDDEDNIIADIQNMTISVDLGVITNRFEIREDGNTDTHCVCEEEEKAEEEDHKEEENMNLNVMRGGGVGRAVIRDAGRLEALAEQIEQREARQQLRKIQKENIRLEITKRKKGKRKGYGSHLSYTANMSASVVDCASTGGRCASRGADGSSAARFGKFGLSASNNASATLNWEGVDLSLYSSRRDPMCHIDGLECSRMDDEHWKVAPFWTHGPFCFCPNANNNTYWCLRSVNETHNFLFCEFITGFFSYYDMSKDPHQLRNAVHDLSRAARDQLRDALEKLKGCKGSRQCNLQNNKHSSNNGHAPLSERSQKQNPSRRDSYIDTKQNIENSNHRWHRPGSSRIVD